jgi:hypothetical protein
MNAAWPCRGGSAKGRAVVARCASAVQARKRSHGIFDTGETTQTSNGYSGAIKRSGAVPVLKHRGQDRLPITPSGAQPPIARA